MHVWFRLFVKFILNFEFWRKKTRMFFSEAGWKVVSSYLLVEIKYYSHYSFDEIATQYWYFSHETETRNNIFMSVALFTPD